MLLDQGLSHQQASGSENREQYIIHTGPDYRCTAELCTQPRPLGTIDYTATHSTNNFVSFADNTIALGLISDDDEAHYGEDVQTTWS